MLAALPLMIIPFILYNLGMLGILGGGGVASLGNVISSLQMLSGAVWTMTLGDVIIVISLVFLFVEILKAKPQRPRFADQPHAVDAGLHRLSGRIPAGAGCRRRRSSSS
jgi:hypothetical protein